MNLQDIIHAAQDFVGQGMYLIYGAGGTDNADELVCRNKGGIPSGRRADGSLICLPKPKPLPNTPVTQSIPKISQPPTVIYQDNTTNITINITRVYPDLPERRLSRPDLPVGGGRSDSVLKKIITVNTAIKNAKYGHLLHEPITNSPVAFQVCIDDDYGKALQEKQKLAAKSFLEGLFAIETEEENGLLPQPNYSMSKASVALINTKDFSVGALFGIEGINDFISSFLSRVSFEIPITGTIPLNYEYVDCTHKETQVSELLANLKVLNIQEYIESLGLDNVSNQLNSISAKTGVASSSDEATGQEYLHNQLVSISAKTGVASSSDEATGQEYLYNQSISSSVKNPSTNIDKLLEVVGVDDFPVNVPETLITSIEQIDLVNPPPIPHKNLTSIPQLLHWYIERFDEVVGQWGIPIEIKDTDPTTPGDQSKLMTFPNLAELLAEMMMMIFQISINSELLTNLNTRILMEAGQDKQQNLITYKLLHSLTDFIGYNYKDEIIEMPLLFDPKAKTFDQMLKEVQVKVPVPEFNEKFNLQADLMRFRKAASILDSVYFKKVDPNGDIKAQLMKRLFDLRDSLKDMNKNDDESFKEFLKQVEAGFTGTPGVGDSTKPYGNDYDDRPRFKDFDGQGTPDNI